MKKIILGAVMCLFSLTASAQVNQMLGKWTTIDDKTEQPMSVVNIYKGSDGLYYGQIEQLLVKGHEDELCTECEGADHNKPVKGLIIIRGMKADGNQLVGGKVLDPDNGKFYYAKISLKDGKLVLRGSLDKAGLFGRNQTWIRKK